MADQLAPPEMRQRKQSVGTVELQGPNGQVKTVALEEMTEADRQLAAEFGYKPVFKREFGYLSSFSFAVSISGLFSTVATTFSAPLVAGGSASAVWCWLISGAGCMCIAASVAELVSAYPTCGGLYVSLYSLRNEIVSLPSLQLLYRLSTRTKEMGAVYQLGRRLAEFARPGCWRGIFRMGCCRSASGRSLHGFRLYLPAVNWPYRWRHGCSHCVDWAC